MLDKLEAFLGNNSALLFIHWIDLYYVIDTTLMAKAVLFSPWIFPKLIQVIEKGFFEKFYFIL